ncbi:hypothetical protein FNV43_RR20358 [Rhamnella rubrinervis]|uniref:Uncharacterized protein n=1 Tax=Rhamnella rubrinervis TaxID=2594499 RepID=A0A8K0E6B1_9ROSA|nr:hypothetical protein FNV43_RR20358 [Rhamnella rubrinervis]
MADIVVPLVLENLIKLLTHEANLLLGVEDQVDLLRDDLGFMIAFLEKSEGKRNDGLVKELVDQIRNAAHESEDVIETYAARVIKQRRRNLLAKLLHWIDDASVLHGVGNKTSSIKNKIKNIYENKAIYGIDIVEAGPSNIDGEAERVLQRRRRNVEEDDVVGFVNDTTTLVNQLTDPGNLRREVFSIIGMHGWVGLLLDLLARFKQITEEISKKTGEHLKGELHEELTGKRYFIVMDDIWSTHVWDEVSVALPDESNGSRILITSRVSRRRMPLQFGNSWEATYKELSRVFVPDFAPPQTVVQSVADLQNKMSVKAWGTGVVPAKDTPTLKSAWLRLSPPRIGKPSRLDSGQVSNLALPRFGSQERPLRATMAVRCSALTTSEPGQFKYSPQKTFRPAEPISHSDPLPGWIGSDNQFKDLSILSLGPDNPDQPSTSLKPCFLYLGVFPEDYEIDARVLTELWIAEGLIQPNGNMSVIDVAEENLEQLIDRSLIQLARKRSDGGVKTCRIHDLLRDLCIRESSQDKFLEFYSKASISSISKSRRLSFQHFSKESLRYLPRTTRSLLLINNSDPSDFIPKSVFTNIFICSKFIRVLFLIDANIWKIPSKIDQLVFLRCLWIKDSSIHGLPSSISNLWYLETIHLAANIGNPLPKGIWSVMKNLRTLYVKPGTYNPLPKPPRRLMGESFGNLKVLYWLKVDQNAALVIAKFPNLRKLGLTFSGVHVSPASDLDAENAMTSVGELESLQSFKLSYFPTYNRVCVRLNSFPSTLTKISLAYCKLDQDHFEALARQPHVRVLKLKSSRSRWVEVPHLVVSAGDFPQLEVLKMRKLSIRRFTMGKKAMPNLQRLIIRQIDSLRDLPYELWSITTLQLVEVSDVSYELSTKLRDLKTKYSGACKIIIN